MSKKRKCGVRGSEGKEENKRKYHPLFLID
jgi:hypothetical protein